MREATIHGLLSARAADHPDRLAVEDGAQRLTYAELERRSDRMAARLRESGIGPGRRVAVCLERSVTTVVSLLAVLKSGGAYVALDPAHPAARSRHVLDDVRPAMVLASRHTLGLLPSGGPRIVPVERLAAREAAPGPAPEPVDPRELAYVVYTSGSTGRPKGVMAEHRTVVGFMTGIGERLGLGPGTRFLQFSPITFDSSVVDIHAVLAAGGTIVMPTAISDLAGQALVRFMRDWRITAALLPPALLAELAEDPPLPDLRTLAYLGETCPPHAAARWSRGRRLVNVYGPAEATVAATAANRTADDRPPPIGRPLPGYELHVLGPDLRPVPDGEPGELHIGGDCLARGYLGLPALTATRFHADPFSDRPGARLYRTGDRVRRLPDGDLDFIGRADDRLDLRGHRIELGEVEAALAAQPGVRACAVVVRGTGADATLTGFVTGSPVGDRELAAGMAALLPAYMVPTAFVRLAALPVNAHGKVERAVLRGWCADGCDGRPFVAPEPGAQSELAWIWREVLGTGRIGADRTFRSLGANSLQAVRALVRIRERFGVAMTAGELLGSGSLADLADLLTADAGRERTALPPIRPTGGAGSFPASAHQRRVWALAATGPAAGAACNEASALLLRGPLDPAALRAALGDLTLRHEALRCALRPDGQDLRVHVADRAAVELPVEDLTRAADPRAAARRRIAALAAEPFDLAGPPPLRAALWRTGPQEHLFALVTHQGFTDGLSLDVIDRDLARYYAARLAGADPRPRPAPVSQRDHTAWQREIARHPATAAGLARWRELLAGAPAAVELPADLPRPPAFSHRGARVQRSAGPRLRRAVEELARAEGSTPYVVCLTAMGILLARLTGRRDVLIGSPAAGRPDRDAEDAVGFFANTVVMRVRLEDEQPVRAVLAATGAFVREALQHQYASLDDVVRTLGDPPGGGERPPFQAVLDHRGALRPHACLAGTEAVPLLVDNGTAAADLAIEVHETADDLVLVAVYGTDVFRAGTARRLLARYAGILHAVTAAPHEPVAVLLAAADPPAPAEERDRAAATW